MSDEKALSYYERNREARKAYQRERYQLVKERLKRKREIAKELDTEERRKYLEYQKAYYRENKEKLKEKRRLKREQARLAKEQGADQP